MDKIRCGIFTKDYNIAKQIMDRYYNGNKDKNNVEYYRQNKINLNLRLKDGTDYIWIKPIDSSRGYRCSKAHIDLNISDDILQKIVMPICSHCKKNDIEIFDTSIDKDNENKYLYTLIKKLIKVGYICGNVEVEISQDGIYNNISFIEMDNSLVLS